MKEALPEGKWPERRAKLQNGNQEQQPGFLLRGVKRVGARGFEPPGLKYLLVVARCYADNLGYRTTCGPPERVIGTANTLIEVSA